MATASNGWDKPPDNDERRLLVNRVLASHPFEKATRLRHFLSYVCNRSLDDPGSRIHEEEIALSVFSRSPDSQNDDTIVRVHASQLRKRLEQYFSGLGRNEELILEIPKGSYTPVFRRRDPRELTEPEQRGGSRWERISIHPFVLAGFGALVVALLAISGWLWYDNRQSAMESSLTDDAHRNVRLFWSSFLTKDRHTDVILADSSLSLFADLIHRSLSLQEYLSHNYMSFAGSLEKDPQMTETARMLMTRQHTTLGDANLVRKLSLVDRRDGSSISIVYARDYHIRQFKADNVILVGAPRANPWVELIEGQLNFRFDYNEERQYAIIRNHAPLPSEEAVYSVHREGGKSRHGYAVLAYLPNPTGEGSVLYIAGTEMEGTEACGDFLISEHWMSELRKKLTNDPANRRFPYFEVLLSTVVVGGAAPELTIVSHRTRK